MSAGRRVGIVILACLGIGGIGAAQRPEGRPPPRRSIVRQARVPRLPDAELQLKHARTLKQRRVGTSDSMRAVWAERAVEAYRMVREYHPEARAVGAESAFRAGQLLVTARDRDRAKAEFRIARALGHGTVYRARAGLEIGHVERRAKRFEHALEAFLDVAADGQSDAGFREDAWIFAGDAWRAIGAIEDARRAWRRVARDGTDPKRRILAFDRLGLLWIDEGDLEAAAGVLHECTRALAQAAQQRTQEGNRTRRALDRMRLASELSRRIAARYRAKRDRSSTEEP